MMTPKIGKMKLNYFKLNEDRQILWVLLGIPLFLLFLIVVFPLCYTFFLSFFDWNLLTSTTPKFVGILNYIKAFTDSTFLYSALVTFHFTIIAVGLEMVFGFILALLLRKPFRGVNIFRTAVIIPYVITGVVAGIVWKWILNPDFGFLRFISEFLHMPGLSVLGNPSLALYGLVITDVWHMTPLVFLLLLAGLQSLPDEVYQSASIDGANQWQCFFYLTLPMMKRIIMITTVIRLLAALKTFDKVLALTEGGPGLATQIMSWTIYIIGFRSFDFGYASAISYLLLFVVLIFTTIYGLLLNKEGGQN